MDLVVVLGAVGSVASLIGLLLPSQGWKQRALHVVYGLAIFAFASSAVWYQQKLARINQVERVATQLVKDRRMSYTHVGFIQAALAFLEKNKDLFPDSYARAQEICRLHQCLANPHAGELSQNLGLVNAAAALEGLVRGIAVVHEGS